MTKRFVLNPTLKEPNPKRKSTGERRQKGGRLMRKKRVRKTTDEKEDTEKGGRLMRKKRERRTIDENEERKEDD